MDLKWLLPPNMEIYSSTTELQAAVEEDLMSHNQEPSVKMFILAAILMTINVQLEGNITLINKVMVSHLISRCVQK